MPVTAKDIELEEKDRSRLDEIVLKMTSNKESEEDISFVVNDFKSKYGLKKKEPSPTSSTTPSTFYTPSEKIQEPISSPFGEKPKELEPAPPSLSQTEGALQPVGGLEYKFESAQPVERISGSKKIETDAIDGFSSALQRGWGQGEVADYLALGQTPSKEQLRRIAEIKRGEKELKPSKAYQDFNSAPNAKEALKTFINDPFEITTQLVGESLSALVRHGSARAGTGALAGGLAGSVVPGAGTLAGAGTGFIAGMGVSGLNLEVSSSILESLQEAGIDVSDENQLIEGFNDEEKMKTAREFAFKRGIPIAVFDMVSAGLGGKILSRPAKSLIGKLGGVSAEVGIQSGLAGTGELAAQTTAGQEISTTSILAEMIGETGGGAPDIVVGTMIEKKKAGKPIKEDIIKAKVKKEQFDDMVDISEGAGQITPQQADELKKDFDDVKKAQKKTPDEFKENEEVLDLVQQKNELEKKKEKVDKMFHPELNEKIKDIEEKAQKIITPSKKIDEGLAELEAIEKEEKKEAPVVEGKDEIKEDDELKAEEVVKEERVIPLRDQEIPIKEKIEPSAESPLYTAKDQKHVVKMVGNELKVVNRMGDEVGEKTKRTILKEYEDKYDYTKGERASDVVEKESIQFKDENESNRYIAEKSNNPIEIIQAHESLGKFESQKSYTDQILDDVIGKINPDSYKRFGDPNNVTQGIAKRFFNKEGRDIDEIAQEASEMAGSEITPQDIVNFVESDKYERKVSPEKELLRQRFKSITGFTLNDRVTQKAIKKELEKYNKEYEKHLEIESRDYADAERQYYEGIKSGAIPIEGAKDVSASERVQEVGKGESSKVKEPKPTKEDRKARANAKINEGLEGLSGIKKITGENAPKVLESLKKIAEGLSEHLEIKGEELIKALKEKVGEAYHKFIDENVNEIIPKEAPKQEPLSEKEYSGIKKALVSDEKISQVEIEKKSVEEMLDKGKELVDSGEINPETIVGEIANGRARALQPNEVASLVYYKAKLDNAISKVHSEINEAISKGDSEAQWSAEARKNQLEKQLDEYHVMQVKTAYEQSLAFRLRKMLLDSEYNLQTQINKYKAANDGVIPTEVEAKFRQYDKELKDANEKLREAEERAAKAEENLTIKNIRASVDRSKSRTYKAKAKDVADQFRKLKTKPPTFTDANGNPIQVFTSGISWNDLIEVGAKAIEKAGEGADFIDVGVKAIVNHISQQEWYKGMSKADKEAIEGQIKSQFETIEKTKGKIKIKKSILKDLIERGIDNIEDFTKGVREAIKDEYPTATERQVRDAITGYGKEANLSRNEIDTQIRKMKRVGKLISSIEDAQKKQRPLKASSQRDKLSKEEVSMKKELKGLLKYLPLDEKDVNTKLEAIKTKVRDNTAELERRIREQDFSKEEKRPLLKMDDEVVRLKAQQEAVKEKYNVEHEKNELRKQPLAKKIWDISKDAILSVPKSLQASWDMSAPFRQGLINTLRPSRIKLTGNEFKTMVEHAFSEKKADDWLRYIKSTPEYPLMKQSGLFLAEANAKLSAREEVYKSNLVQRIPYLKHLFKGSERAYNGFLNAQRVNEFLRVAEKFKKDGIDPKTKEGAEVYDAWANYVNNATGRGSMGSFEMSANKLSDIFFSPRLIAARFNILNPGFYAKMPPKARMEAIKTTTEFIGVGLTVIALAKLAGADVEDDPRSSDFGKIKIGNTRLDIWGGHIQWVRMFAQLISGERKSTTTGEIKKLGEKRGDDTRFDVLVNFFKNKLAPTPALAVRLAESKLKEGKEGMKIVGAFGEETTLSEEAIGQVVPLYLQDFNKLRKEHDPATLTGLMIASFLGFGVQDYNKNKDVSKNDSTKIVYK